MEQNGSEITMRVFKAFGGAEKTVIRLTKIKEGKNPKYASGHPRHIKVGSVAEGLMLRPVTVGESFYVDPPKSKKHFHTSVVQEILSENTFRTMNSIYKWERVLPAGSARNYYE